jgi:hypothetical protein
MVLVEFRDGAVGIRSLTPGIREGFGQLRIPCTELVLFLLK